MSACRGCAGDGIDASVSLRRAQLVRMPITMRNDAGSVFHGQVSEHFEVGRLRFQGPLILLAEHVEKRLREGYQLLGSELPDRSLACEWCNGYGSPDGQLTVHTLEKLAERYEKSVQEPVDS